MNNRVNYTLIGILVVISLSFMIAFGYWLLKPSDEQEMTMYNIRFDESVLGLNMDAPVKYRGITVGKVVKLRINPDNLEQVEVLISILKTTPIKTTTVAKLTSHGITGLSYINLSHGHNESPALKRQEGEDYPVIKTIPSLFNQLEASFGSVSDNLSSALMRAQELLSESNQKQFSDLLQNAADSMNRLNNMLNKENQEQMGTLLKKSASVVDKIDKILDENTSKNLQLSISNLSSSSAKLNKLISNSISWEDNISASFRSITKSYNNISSSMLEFKSAVTSGQFNIKDISSELVPTMNSTMVEIGQLMRKLEDVLSQYERSPGDVIFKQEKIRKGPGED